MKKVEGHESPEMYLKTIYMLKKEGSECRSVDVANRMGFSKPSVSVAIGKLKESDYVTVDGDGTLELTEEGEARAKLVYEKYCFWVEVLEQLGIDEKMAEDEACRFEHALSDEGFAIIRQYVDSIKASCTHEESKIDDNPDCYACSLLPWNPCEKVSGGNVS